jgi:hypothetical protein
MCDAETYERSCNGDDISYCNSDTGLEATDDCKDSFSSPPFDPKWTCGAPDCGDASADICELVEEPQCLPATGGGYCTEFYYWLDIYLGETPDFPYFCDGEASCILQFETFNDDSQSFIPRCEES